MNTDECIKYDSMIDMGIATPEEINLVRCLMNGTWNQILDSICYVRTGCETFENYIAEVAEND